MLRLYILRHAKTAIASPGMKDYDRGLTARGADDSAQTARIMRQRNYLPMRILCSPARRTRMTLHGVMSAYSDAASPTIDYIETLYHGEPGDYLKAIRESDGAPAIMVIGHNPNCEAVASMLCANGKPSAMNALRQKFPTGALAVIDLDIAAWEQLRPGTGYLADFLIPNEF